MSFNLKAVLALLTLLCSLFIVYAIATSPNGNVAPTLVNVSGNLTFNIGWTGSNGDASQRVYICRNPGCAGCGPGICSSQYCYAWNETLAASPRSLQYQALQSDASASTTWYFFLVNTTGSQTSCTTGTGSFQVNHKPVFSINSILPASPLTTNDITCTATVSDSDSDTLTNVCSWNGCTGPCPACSISCNSGTCTATLSHTSTHAGNQIYCNFTSKDAHGLASDIASSSTVTVAYSGALTIVPDSALPSGNLEMGSSQIFNATNGAAPYSWHIHNGSAYCSIPSGVTASYITLTGNAVGNCTLNVTDADSRSDLSGRIHVVDTVAPAAVTNLQASDVLGDQGGVVMVSWVVSTNDNEVNRYWIMRSTLPASGFANIVNVSHGVSSYQDSAVNDLTRYYYHVWACDSLGNCGKTTSAVSAIPNAQPKMKSVNITPSVLTASTDVECLALAYDTDNESLSMTYRFDIMAFPPGGYTHNVTGNADCIYFGRNSTDQYGVKHANATTECRALLNHTHITKADKVVCTMVASDGKESSASMRISKSYVLVNNTAPYATNVRIVPQSPNGSSVLSCNYTFNDVDGDSEDLSAVRFKWYINNEGLNQFVEVQNQISKTLSGFFDKDDLVKCAVLVKDLDLSWLHDADYAAGYSNSSVVNIVDNALPQIIAYSVNSNSTKPIAVGQNVVFNVSWVDYEDPADTARLLVCDARSGSESQFSGANTSISFGDTNANSPKYVWFYTNQTGQYVQTIAVKPFKYVQNNEWTYAPDTLVQQGDKFISTILRNFTLEAFYDSDGSGTYDYGEPLIRENRTGAQRLVFNANLDTIISGTTPTDGSVLINLSAIGYRYHDRDSTNNFTAVDDIYWDRDNSRTISLNDYRKTIVTQSSERRLSTQFLYDIYVYEVAAVGDTEVNQTSVLIAEDHNDPFTLGVYNYFVPQYNAQPLAGKHLAFKFCIDSNDDAVCDSDSDFMNDSVYVHASNNTVGEYKVTTSQGIVFYNPDIKLNYHASSAYGCSNVQYCNTSLSSNHVLSCSYQAKDSDPSNNTFVLKVCDQKNGCSVERSGIFYVNHLSSVANVNISSSRVNYTDSANLNCTAYGQYDPDGNTVALSYRWYLSRGSGYTLYDIPSNRILSNGNTLVGDLWKCEVIPGDGFAPGYTRNSSPVLISNVSYSESRLYITSVTDDSNKTSPTNVGSKVSFRVGWSGLPSQVRAFVCNSSQIMDNGCLDFTFNSTSLTSQNPLLLTYTARQADTEENYWVKVCDNFGNCSNNYPGGSTKLNFSVNHLPTIAIVNISASPANYTDNSNLNCTAFQVSDADANNVLLTYKWFVKRGSTFEQFLAPSSQVLSNSNTFIGDVWKCEVLPFDGYVFGRAVNSSLVTIRNLSAESALAILSVTDASNSSLPTNVGDKVAFEVAWSGRASIVRMFVCNSSVIYSTGCAGFTFNSTAFTSANPITTTYTVRSTDFQENYWVRLCDVYGNCSQVFPSAGKTNFTVNHGPNASGIKVLTLSSWYGSVIVCNYTYRDIDLDAESGSEYRWYFDYGSGFEENIGETEKNITDFFSFSTPVKCAVRVKDSHGLSDSIFRNSSAVTLASSPGVPTLWPFPSVVKSNNLIIIGHIDQVPANLTAFANQGVLTPTQQSSYVTSNSTLYGQAYTVSDVASGRNYVLVSAGDSNLFSAGRFIQFNNHDRPYFLRYAILGKADLLDRTFRIDLAENLSSDVPAYTFMSVYNSSKPTGWFNISLNLFNGTNTVRVKARTSVSDWFSTENSVFVDLFPPELILGSLPSVSTLARITLSFNLSENYYAQQASKFLLLKITNKTGVTSFHPLNFSTNGSVYANAIPNISCSMVNFSYSACSVILSLKNGTYNLSFTLNDTAGHRINASRILVVNTSAIITTTVLNGYIDVHHNYLPSDFATTNNLTTNWTVLTGVSAYEYRLDRYNDSLFDRTIIPWKSNGLARAVNITNNVNITNGYVYKFVVRGKLSSGGYTQESSSSGILYLDSTAPTCMNCVHSDGDYTSSNDSLHFYWSFTEHESRIVQYQYAIGTKCYPFTGYTSIVPKTNTTLASVTRTGLQLIDSQSYCLSVKARNENQIWSPWRFANITVDISKPVNGSISYPEGFVFSDAITVSFREGKDNVSGINRTQLMVASLPLVANDCGGIYNYNNYFNYTSNVLGQTYRTVPLDQGRCYKFLFKVIDNAGNAQVYPKGTVKVVKVDKTPPSTFTVTLNNNAFYTQSNTLNVRWTQSQDPESAITKYAYALFMLNGSQVTSYRNTSYTSSTASITAALLHEESYYVKVIAFNGGNASTAVNSNSVLFLDFNPPSPVAVRKVDNDVNGSNGWLDTDADNSTSITAEGELGIDCIISRYNIDYTDSPLPYVSQCLIQGGGPNITCSLNITDGNYTYYIVCRDTNGNSQDASLSTPVNFIVDKYGPNITIMKPARNQTVGGKVDLDAEIRDYVGVDEAIYRIIKIDNTIMANGTLHSPLWNATWNTINKNYSGLFYFFVWANDTLGRRSNASVNFSINNRVPIVDIVSPAYVNNNFTLIINAQLFVNVSFNITNRTKSLLVYKKNNWTSMRTYLSWSNLINIMSPAWAEGNYTINAWAVNLNKNKTLKSSVFTVDLHAPKYSNILNTSAKTYYRTGTINLTVSWSDNFKLGAVKFRHNVTGNWTNETAVLAGTVYRVQIPSSALSTGQSIGWFSFAKDMANNSNTSMPVRSFTLGNRAPVLAALPNQTINATDTVTIIASATDPDQDNRTYYINDSRFNHASLYSNMFNWTTDINDSGLHVVNLTASDGRINVSRKVWITVLAVDDTDGDGIPDYKETDSDNDGFNNTIDFLNGYPSNVKTNIANFNCSIAVNSTAKTFNFGQLFTGTRIINCTNTSSPILTFSYNFSKQVTLHMIRINVTRQPAGSEYGWIIVRGLSLLPGTTKTVFVNHINSTSSGVCIKDATNVTSVSQFTSSCTGTNEFLIACDGHEYYSKYTCTLANSSYKVDGLRYSAVKEQRVGSSQVQQIVPPSTGGGGGGGGGLAKAKPQCSNNLDDDHDGLIDLADPGCTDKLDNSEAEPIESWVCTDWSECSAQGIQKRSCVDKNNCGTYKFVPEEQRACKPVFQAGLEISPTCFDGLQNDGETGLDCGGVCPACPTCVDNIRNQGELGVDCSGPCPACTRPPVAEQPKKTFPYSLLLLSSLVILIVAAAVLYPQLTKQKRKVFSPLKQQRLLEAQEYVLSSLHNGLPRSEIEAALLAKGWPVDMINKLIKLENYVRVACSRGHSGEMISSSLQKVGWQPELIDEILDYCRKGT
ncbi:MAG: hypothetical protein V1837_07645 [Candidatus Woesearchaeota archaeon]